MSKIKGEYIPTEEDIKNLELFIEEFEKSVIFPKYKVEEPKDWKAHTAAYIKHWPNIGGMYNPVHFYQSKVFPFIMKTDKGDKLVDFKLFKSEKDFQNFIKHSQYLIHGCCVDERICTTSKKRSFGVYYHKDFGKVGWLRGRSQFILQRFCSVQFLQWFYGIRKFKCPKLSITTTNKCDD